MKRILVAFLLITGLFAVEVAEDNWRTYAQSSPAAYTVMIQLDLANFWLNGGGSYDYRNVAKWNYAHLHKNKATAWQKFWFWNQGFMYDASNPPEEHRYPPLFDT